MATNRMTNTTQAEEPARNGKESGTAPAPAPSGGIKAWIPLIANLILMPVIAYALTTFVLIPKLGGATAPAEEGGSSHGSEESGGHGSSPKGSKVMVPLSNKVLVNVAGTMGTRYLVANITLVGSNPSLKARVDENDPQLRDSAGSILSSKSISDLEKPGMRNLIRAELISAFNEILGKDLVAEIYLTEFAIQ